MNRQLELDINRPAWHDVEYESAYTKSWAERAKKFAQTDDKKPVSEPSKIRIATDSEPHLK